MKIGKIVASMACIGSLASMGCSSKGSSESSAIFGSVSGTDSFGINYGVAGPQADESPDAATVYDPSVVGITLVEVSGDAPQTCAAIAALGDNAPNISFWSNILNIQLTTRHSVETILDGGEPPVGPWTYEVASLVDAGLAGMATAGLYAQGDAEWATTVATATGGNVMVTNLGSTLAGSFTATMQSSASGATSMMSGTFDVPYCTD